MENENVGKYIGWLLVGGIALLTAILFPPLYLAYALIGGLYLIIKKR